METLKKIFLPVTAPIRFIQNNFKATLLVLFVVMLLLPSPNEEFSLHNLEKISLNGPIFDASEIVEKINKAAENPHVKGILLSVDSPGGAVAPSVEIAYAVKRAAATKPVVVYAKGTLASGSYYASIWADKIIANPGSMVGSIGVILQGADLSSLMDKIGIKSQVVKAGKYKQVGTSERPWKKEEIAELNKVIQGTYDMFTQDVAKARDLNISQRHVFADAHIFTASQAQEVGLIDSVGVEFDAKNKLASLSGVENPVWNKEDKFDKILQKFSASTAAVLHTYFPTLVLR